MKTYEKLLETLETLIDANDLEEVAAALAQVARLKAVHIGENWQDDSLKKSWLRDAKTIESILTKFEN